MADDQTSTYLGSLKKFEKRCDHHKHIYSWVQAFRMLLPDFAILRAWELFYNVFKVENYSENAFCTEFTRIRTDAMELKKINFFITPSRDILHQIEKQIMINNMLIFWIVACRVIIPDHSINKCILQFFNRHSTDIISEIPSSVDIANIKKYVNVIEKNIKFESEWIQV